MAPRIFGPIPDTASKSIGTTSCSAGGAAAEATASSELGASETATDAPDAGAMAASERGASETETDAPNTGAVAEALNVLLRQSANWPASRPETSAIMPRPNWAGAPVT